MTTQSTLANLKIEGLATPKQIAAIIDAKAHFLDFDGTVADNEGFALRQIQRIIEDELSIDNKHKLDKDFVLNRAGRPKLEIIDEYRQLVHARHNILNPVSLSQDFANAVEARIIKERIELSDDAGVHLMDGAYDFIAALKEKSVLYGINSSSERPRLELHIRHLGLAYFFNSNAEQGNVVSCETDIGHDRVKPDAAGYQRIAKRLGILPKDGVAYEDSVSGITSAKNAHVGTCVGIIGGEHILDKEAHAKHLMDAGADCIIHDFKDLADALVVSPPLVKRAPK